MTSHVGSALLAALHRAITSLSPARLVREELEKNPFAVRPRLVALGKSALDMTAGAIDARNQVSAGLVITPPRGSFAFDARGGEPIEIFEGDHPIPGARSFFAGRRLLQFAEEDSSAPLLALVSGGGSALAEVPRAPLTDDDLVRLGAAIVAAGWPIAEMNALRRAWSELKGGGVLKRRRGLTRTLILSDVPGGHPSLVSSGPTLPPPPILIEPLDLAARLGKQAGLDLALRDRLAAAIEASRFEIPRWPLFDVVTLAEPKDLAAGLTRELEAFGIASCTAGENLDAPLDEIVALLASEAERQANGTERDAPMAILVVAEPTLPLPPNAPAGGRAAHVALSLAIRLSANRRIQAVLAAASDGVDGTGGGAGALLDRAFLDSIRIDERSAGSALDRFDATSFLAHRGVLLPEAPTGLNLRDLYSIVVE